MVPLAILLIPVAAASILGFFYGPAVQALNPGNEIITASNHTFLSDTFSLKGSIGSLVESDGSPQPFIITGTWELDIQDGNATLFEADLEMINADGSGYRAIRLANLTSNGVEMNDNGTASTTGTIGVKVNGTALPAADIRINVARLKTITIVVDSADIISGQPVYGIADLREASAASLETDQETGLGLDNITEKFQLPELPNPFR
jgi:hypothetical protein